MSTKIVFTAVIALCLSAAQAFAEGDGNGNPFPFHADYEIPARRAFVVDTGSAAYPQVMGNSTLSPDLAQLEPVVGSEASIQAVNSLPPGFGVGGMAYAQAQSLNRYLSARLVRARYRTAGTAQPKS